MEQKMLKIFYGSQQGPFYWLSWAVDEAAGEHLPISQLETWLNPEHHKWGGSSERKQNERQTSKPNLAH